MTQYINLNVKISNSQLNQLKCATKKGTEATLNLSSTIIGHYNDENNFQQKLLSTNAQVAKLCKAFSNGSSVNIKFSKSQLHKIVQSGGFLDGLLGQLLKTGLHLIGNVLKPLAIRVSMPLRLTTSASAIDAAIHKKYLGLNLQR